MNTVFKSTAIALCLTAIPTAALANQKNDTIEVSYTDLNLASEYGIKVLDRRISSAIEKVCGGPAPRDVDGAMKVRRCIARTKPLVSGQRDLAIDSYRTDRLASTARVIRLTAK